jgi:hypothetical protein
MYATRVTVHENFMSFMHVISITDLVCLINKDLRNRHGEAPLSAVAIQ